MEGVDVVEREFAVQPALRKARVELRHMIDQQRGEPGRPQRGGKLHDHRQRVGGDMLVFLHRLRGVARAFELRKGGGRDRLGQPGMLVIQRGTDLCEPMDVGRMPAPRRKQAVGGNDVETLDGGNQHGGA